MTCPHDNMVFDGTYSLKGNYRCKDCGEIITPKEYCRIKGDLHTDLIDYYTKYPDRLKIMWRNHPKVRHLYGK
jgi:hypothetical protein